MNDALKVKITFPLERDDDGYPPEDFETLWAEDLGGGNYRMDNIPFYIQGISPDDIVTAHAQGSELFFAELLNKSDISVIQIIFLDKSWIDRVLQELLSMGSKYEGSHVSSLFSIEVPSNVSYNDIINYLEIKNSMDILEYQEASIRS
jgi:hypothetical protein